MLDKANGLSGTGLRLHAIVTETVLIPPAHEHIIGPNVVFEHHDDLPETAIITMAIPYMSKPAPTRLRASCPQGTTFSTKIMAATRTIQARFITPTAKSTTINPQQHPTQ